MSRFVAWLRDPGARGYLYRVIVAAGAVAVGYGIVTTEQAAMWAGFVAVLFAVPAIHTPTTAQRRQDEPELPDEPDEPVRWVRR